MEKNRGKGDGKQALDRVLELRPDLVLMDVSMPVMDGIEATRRIKEQVPRVRIVGLSMHEDEHTARSMLDAGAEAFLNKVTSSAELLNVICGNGRGD